MADDEGEGEHEVGEEWKDICCSMQSGREGEGLGGGTPSLRGIGQEHQSASQSAFFLSREGPPHRPILSQSLRLRYWEPTWAVLAALEEPAPSLR